MKQAKTMDAKLIQSYIDAFSNNADLEAMRIALSGADIMEAAYDNTYAGNMPYVFSIDIPTLPPTNQGSSGRCWLFSALHVMREHTAKKYNLDAFEFSENYLSFWDKFEKINYFLESIIATAGLPLTDRTVMWILDNGIVDGGQWDMMVNLVKKYGLVPMSAMNETHQSSNTRIMNLLLNSRMRACAAELRSMIADGEDVALRKEEMMGEFYTALCLCFGQPPQTFDFAFTDKNKAFTIDRGLTPQRFFEKYVAFPLDDYVSIISAPTADKPYEKSYTVDYINNVVGGRPVQYLNVDMDTYKNLVLKQLQDGEVVWFGSDVSKFGNRNTGIWDMGALRYDALLHMEFSLSKEDALDYRDSAMNHAMVITGVNLDEEGVPDRYKIQNSWGPDKADKGYYMMGAAWFDRYVYQAAVHKKYFTEAQLDAYKDTPKHLDPWDPMGTLALCK